MPYPQEMPDARDSGAACSGLIAEGLTVCFPGQETPALAGVDLEVAQGRVLGLLGPSGCGKSTALRVIAGLQEAAGRVRYDGRDVTRLPAHRRGFSLMFQDGQLFGHLDVFDNVAYGMRRRRVPRAEIDRRVGELLDLVGLAGYERRAPATLSGGQQQRVALARALAPRPRLLLLDEPLSALDRALRERLAVDVREVIRSEGVTALFVTHDHDEAFTVADDLALMRAGRVVQTGAAAAVWQRPADPEAAGFLGYPTILDAAEARQLGLSDGSWAVRRTAWQVAEPSEEGLVARITQVRGTGDLLDVTFTVHRLGGRAVEASLLAGRQTEGVGVGASLRLAFDPSRAVRLP